MLDEVIGEWSGDEVTPQFFFFTFLASNRLTARAAASGGAVAVNVGAR